MQVIKEYIIARMGWSFLGEPVPHHITFSGQNSVEGRGAGVEAFAMPCHGHHWIIAQEGSKTVSYTDRDNQLCAIIMHALQYCAKADGH